jgi:serine/threonine protein kinase
MPETVRFDHYEVLTRDDGSLFELGRGAMGVTYKAMDTNLRIPVCLKVIAASHLHSEIARQRFIREARSAARLQNANVAAVYHLGQSGDTWFYAMEFIDGDTVDALIKRNGRLPAKLALEITDQVAKALGAAEPHGLVHRDIKPANLMVVRDGDNVIVKVIDFGLAKSSLPDDDSATLSMGGFVGTPHFASPEQLEEKDLDVRSDIYSLGVTLWFMLAGKTPFAGSMAQVMSQHLSKTPPFEKLNVQPPLARLLRRLLEKKALDRPQTAAELRREVTRCLGELESPEALSAPSEPLAPRDAQESFLTMVDPSLVGGEAAKFEPGALVAARYRIIEALGDSNLGHVFRAHDQTRAEDVRIVVLHESLTLSTEAMSALERMLELLIPRSHPNVQRIDALETIEGASFLVMEWLDGASMVELLRARRELDAPEVLALLTPAAAGLDHVLACGVEETEIALHRVLVTFSAKPPEDWLHQPHGMWPDHSVKVNPFSRRGAESAGETWAGAQTQVEAPRATGGAAGRAVRSLAAIAYELLGGKLSPAALATGSIDFKPLAALNEAGNEVLRRALSPEPPFRTASDFMKALSAPDTADLPRRDHYGTASPTRMAASHAAAERSSTVVEAPAKKSSSGMVVAVVAVLLLGGGAFWWFKLRPVPQPPIVNNTTSTTTEPSTTTTTDIPTPEPPKPTPDMSRKIALDKGVAEAKALEAKEAWGPCLAAWVQVAKDFPESGAGKTNLEAVCGTLRSRPDGLGADFIEATKEPLTEAANLDVLSAMMVLAENLRRSDPQSAFQWFNRAGEKGDLEGLTQAGLMTADGKGTERSFEKAAAMFETAASKGHPSAKRAFAECLLFAKGVDKDEARAITLLKEASNASDKLAFDLLGFCYTKGIGVEKDLKEAARLYEKAAEAGLPRAWGNLGVLYVKPDGLPTEPARAFAYFRKGSDGNDPLSMFFLAQCYEGGTGTRTNFEQARTWYRKSAQLGWPAAREWCKKNNVDFGGPVTQ